MTRSHLMPSSPLWVVAFMSYFSLYEFCLRLFVSPVTFHKIRWSVSAQFYVVICCGMAIPSHDILRVCPATHMTYKVVDRVLVIAFTISLGRFCTVANRFVMGFFCSSRDTLNCPLLTTSIAYGQVCRNVFSRQPFRVLGLAGRLCPCLGRLYV